ncbi:hypothetical protein ACWDO7_16105 [Streptomyces sp. NPDC003656]
MYDIRHTRLTKWLNDGIPPAQVADWAGNSVPVLLATYARCVEGQLPDLMRERERHCRLSALSRDTADPAPYPRAPDSGICRVGFSAN